MNSESAPVAIMERVPPRALEARPQADRAAVFSMRALRQVFLLAGKEFGDRLRSGWVLACVLVWLGAVIFTSLFGLVQIGHVGLQGYERTVVSLLNLVQYLVPLLGLLLGHDLVVGEREERTLPLLLAAGVSADVSCWANSAAARPRLPCRSDWGLPSPARPSDSPSRIAP